MRMQEGEQYFVNRITFVGNTTTRDNVIRREVRLLEGGVFNTEALKYSVKRINQLGYFKTIEEDTDDHQGREDARREEQGRRHAEVRGAEPEPAHLRRRRVAVRGVLRPAVVPDVELPRPRRERHVLGARRQRAPRTTSSRSPSRSCSIGRSRPASTSSSASSIYLYSYTQESAGGNVVVGFPVRDFTRDVHDLQPAAGAGEGHQPAVPRSRRHRPQPVPADALLLGESGQPHDQPGHARASSTTRSTTRSSRHTGQRLHGQHGLRGHRRQRQLHQAAGSRASGCSSTPRRTSAGRPRAGRVHQAVRQHRPILPIFERLFLGRRVQRPRLRHPLDRPARPDHRASCIGGNKSLLFNAEYLITIAGPGAAGAVLRRRPGAGRRAAASRGTSSRCRPAPKSGSSCRC